MGQYYIIANLDKRQFINPHSFGDGAKLMEFGASGSGIMCGLAILLSDGNDRGGGDLHVPENAPEELKSLVGSWAGDRIVVSGDYADKGVFTDDGKRNLYELCGTSQFENISEKVIEVMCFDPYLKRDLVERTDWLDAEKLPECLKESRHEKEQSTAKG